MNMNNLLKLQSVDHYKFIEKYGPTFTKPIELKHCDDVAVWLSCDGDKVSQYKDRWEKVGIPFPIGAMILLLGKETEFVNYLRDTPNGWVAPCDWVIEVFNSSDDHIVYHGIKKGIKAVLAAIENEVDGECNEYAKTRYN